MDEAIGESKIESRQTSSGTENAQEGSEYASQKMAKLSERTPEDWEALKFREEEYEHLLQYAPTAICEVEFEGPRFKRVNDAMCIMSGFSREELLATNPFDLLDASSLALVRDRMPKFLAGEESNESIEYAVVRKDGTKAYVTFKAKFLSKDGKKLDRALVVAHDITERKKAEEALRSSEARFRSLYENSLDAVLLMIPDGTILNANPAAQRMFGMTEGEIKRAGGTDLIAYDRRFVNGLEERARTGRMHTELVFRRKDGSTFEGELTSNFFTDADGTTKTSMIIRDITERKRNEEEIRVYSNNLERLVRERTRELEQALESERRSRSEAELLQDILTHDIRNYNQIAQLSAEMLMEEVKARQLSGITVLLDAILQGINGSTVLVERAKKLGFVLGDKSSKLQPINILQTIKASQLLITTASAGSDKEIHHELRALVPPQTEPIVLADDLLHEVFDNLYSNSVRYTDGKKVDIETIVTEEDGVGDNEEAPPSGSSDGPIAGGRKDTTKDSWRIQIIDKGKGIEDKSKLFIRYLSKTSKGSGLGMSIVYALVVERYKGKISIRDRVEGDYTKGTAVEILLPKA